MKHLPGDTCSAMQCILITATSNYSKEKNHKAGVGIFFPPKHTSQLKNNRKAAALTIRPEAASPSASKNSTRIQSPPGKRGIMGGEIGGRLIARAKVTWESHQNLSVLKTKDHSSQDRAKGPLIHPPGFTGIYSGSSSCRTLTPSPVHKSWRDTSGGKRDLREQP